MKYARIELNGKQTDVTLKEFISVRAENPGVVFAPVCCECGQDVHTYNEKGALGIRMVNEEVTRRYVRNMRSQPGFHHLDNQAGENCPVSFAHDMRFKGLGLSKNKFDALEIKRNKEALSKEKVLDAIKAAYGFYMEELTGQKPTDATYAELAKILKKILPMKGLADNLWAAAPIAALITDPKIGKKGLQLQYTGVGGERGWKINSLDGVDRTLYLPNFIQISLSRRGGLAPRPFWQHGKAVKFAVTRDSARNVVKDVWCSERRVVSLPPVPVPTKRVSQPSGPRQLYLSLSLTPTA